MDGLLGRLQRQRSAPARALGIVPQVFEEALAGLPLHRVNVVAEFIGAGPITGYIIAVRIEYEGAEVTEVPQGEHFDVWVEYYAEPVSKRAEQWEVCATMIAATGELANYDVTLTVWPADYLSGAMKLDSMGKPGPMPDHDITLMIKLWGNTERTSDPPDQALWY